MKIAIGQIFEETNTFSPIRTNLEDFKRYGLYFGSTIMEKFADVNELGGFISTLKKEKGIDIVPLLRAFTWPSGRVTKDAINLLREELLLNLQKALPVEGVLLSLHGAMVSEDIEDVEGELLSNVRDCLGKKVPIVSTLDLHANITNLMIESSNVLIGYHTCPHTDLFETGVKAAEIMLSIISGQINPSMRYQKIPMITPADKHNTNSGPLKELFSRLKEIESLPGVISTSLFPVQLWIDVPQLGWSVVVVTDSDPERAQRLANEIARTAWHSKNKFFVKKLTPDEAIREALAINGRPVVISDSSDSTNSGAPGDSTSLLKEMLDQKIDCLAYLTLVDPQAVEQAMAAGVGSNITLKVGGKQDNIYSEPVKISARVKTISDGRFIIEGHMGKKLSINMGKTVVLEVGSLRIVISEHKGPVHEQNIYRNVGLNPEDAKIVVVKSPVGFRADYEPIAKEILLADCPGLAPSNLNLLTYKKVPRPLFPLDKLEYWEP